MHYYNFTIPLKVVCTQDAKRENFIITRCAFKFQLLSNNSSIVFKNDACVDGTSVMNKCILNLFNKWHRKINAATEIKDPFWRIRVVVVKRKAGKNNEYEDITSADAMEVVKFLYRYTEQKSLFINY